MACARSAYTRRTVLSVAGIRPDSKYCAAVACANVDVCASLNCLHIVARANRSGGATIQPTRKPGESTLLKDPQCTNQSRLPGTCSLNANIEGGGASPKYKSPYGSSSMTIVLYCTASCRILRRRSLVSKAPLGLPNVGMM